MELRGSTALVTGASSGIGRAMAGSLAEAGVRVALVARRGSLLAELAGELAPAGHGRPVVLPADLSRRGAAEEIAEQALTALGAVDILVNNAGVGLGGRQATVGDRDEAREVFEVNVWSPLALVARLAPGMLDRGRGAVVNVTSTAQVMTWPFMGYYTATKAALASYTETLRLELSGTPIHVLEVIPGPVDTAVQGETREIPGLGKVLRRMPLGAPEALAARTVAALHRGRATRLVYPRPYWLPYLFPAATRTLSAAQVRQARHELDITDSRVIRSGSTGDAVAVQARQAWERRQPTAS